MMNKVLDMSTQSSNNNKRIAKKTLLLYFRMLFMMAMLLYMCRAILNALGVENFGILNKILIIVKAYVERFRDRS